MSANVAREHACVGDDQGVPSQETGVSGSGCGGVFFVKKSAIQRLNLCHLTAMTESQFLEHSGGNGLDEPPERHSVRGASRVRVLCFNRRRC